MYTYSKSVYPLGYRPRVSTDWTLVIQYIVICLGSAVLNIKLIYDALELLEQKSQSAYVIFAYGVVGLNVWMFVLHFFGMGTSCCLETASACPVYFTKFSYVLCGMICTLMTIILGIMFLVIKSPEDAHFVGLWCVIFFIATVFLLTAAYIYIYLIPDSRQYSPIYAFPHPKPQFYLA